MTIQPFPLVEMAVKEVIETKYPAATGKVGGDFGYVPGATFFVWLGLIPGGSSDETTGEWVLDIDVFAPSYAVAMQTALDIEAALLPGRFTTSVMRLDNVYQNQSPAEIPWDEDGVYRIGAVYVFTARRSG